VKSRRAIKAVEIDERHGRLIESRAASRILLWIASSA
jgi:hypothetical protein